MEHTKEYPNGNILVIHDDEVSEKNVLRATLQKVYTASDGEKYIETIMTGTENDLTSEIDACDKRITELQTKREQLNSRRTALKAELDKLPERKVTTEE